MATIKNTTYLSPKIDSLVVSFAESNGMTKSEAIQYLITKGLENTETINRLTFELQNQQKQFNRLAGLIVQNYKQTAKAASLSKVAGIKLNAYTQEEAEIIETASIQKALDNLKPKQDGDN